MNINELYKYNCYLCGRKYPETELNIEGLIHHNEKPRCLNTKDCRKVAKKLKRKK